MYTYEDIYSEATASFAAVYDAGMVDEETEADVRKVFRDLVEHFQDTSPESRSEAIREAIRDAGKHLDVPEPWLD